MERSVLIFFFLLLNCDMAIANEDKELKSNYNHAFTELSDMLEQKTDVSLKRAVFITENAFLEGKLGYEAYLREVDFLISLIYSVMDADGLVYDHPDRDNVLRAASIFRVLNDTLSIELADGSYHIWLPFQYDMTDFWGEHQWPQMFVTKLLASRKGNCHSLPLLYLILAEALDVNAWLSLAPSHSYIRQWSYAKGWYNTELTTGTFPYDKDIKWNSYIKTEAVANGVYMDTLSSAQTIAYIITSLAHGYTRKFGYQDLDTPLSWLEKALEHYPNFVNGLLLKAELEKKKIEQIMTRHGVLHFSDLSKDVRYARQFNSLEKSYLQIHKLGYRRMPQEMYLNWLYRIKKDTVRQPHSFAAQQPFDTYDYKVIMATAGEGQNYEFYDQQVNVRIGTVEFNRVTSRIERFIYHKELEEIPDAVISRMYDPALGRFWQVDPATSLLVSWSPYTYGLDNPIRYTDPDGLMPEDKILQVTSTNNKDVISEITTKTIQTTSIVKKGSSDYTSLLGKSKIKGTNGIGDEIIVSETTINTTQTSVEIEYDDLGNELSRSVVETSTTQVKTNVTVKDRFGGDAGGFSENGTRSSVSDSPNVSADLSHLTTEAAGYRLQNGISITNNNEYATKIANQRNFINTVDKYTPAVGVLFFRYGGGPSLLFGAGALILQESAERGLRGLISKGKRDSCDNCTKTYKRE